MHGDSTATEPPRRPAPLPRPADWRVDAVPPAEMLRGLSAIFWSLPVLLLAGARLLLTDWLAAHDLAPSLAASGLLLYGLWLCGRFARGDRPWQRALFATRILAIACLGLTPFLFLWNRLPDVASFACAVLLLLGVGLAGLASLNHAWQRLAELLDRPVIAADARLFFNLSLAVLVAIGALLLTLHFRLRAASVATLIEFLRQPGDAGRQALLLLLLLSPLSMTMAVTWKVKEAVLGALTGGSRGPGFGGE